MPKHNYVNPSEHQDTSEVESQKYSKEGEEKYYDEQGWEIAPPISDRECIYRCLENCEKLAGLDSKQVKRLMDEYKTDKTKLERNDEYPAL